MHRVHQLRQTWLKQHSHSREQQGFCDRLSQPGRCTVVQQTEVSMSPTAGLWEKEGPRERGQVRETLPNPALPVLQLATVLACLKSSAVHLTGGL